MFKQIIARWKEPRWQPPLINLDHHAKHMGGGVVVMVVCFLLGMEPLIAGLGSSLIFFNVEMWTVVAKKNWKDSTFDFWQYQAHWILTLLWIGEGWIALVVAIVWLMGYFTMLLRGW